MSTHHSKKVALEDQRDPTSHERKLDHIEMAFQSQLKLHNIDTRFYYEPLLAAHPCHISFSSISFLEKTFQVPIWVSSMTGGTTYANKINTNLAKACAEYGMGMGLGSCRKLLYSDDTLEDFTVRKYIGDQPLYANLGIAQIEQLIEDGDVGLIPTLLSKLEADGLIIHINPLQEWLQPEGDVIKEAPIVTIKRVLDIVDAPIIVKEVGQGMGYASLKALFQLPIAAIDFGANGGTNFAKLEMLRASEEVRSQYTRIANLGHSAEEMVDMSNRIIEELGDKAICKEVIVSGGVGDFLDGYYYVEKMKAKAIYGQASAFLKYAKVGYEELCAHIERQIEGYKLASAFLKVKGNE